MSSETEAVEATGKPLGLRAKVLIAVGGSIVLLSMLVTAVFGYLLAPPKKVLVVTMIQDAQQSDRMELKQDCGGLPGVKLVADRGKASVQGRFPVRFDIGDATQQEEAALEQCINQHSDTVRGFLTEGDR